MFRNSPILEVDVAQASSALVMGGDSIRNGLSMMTLRETKERSTGS